MPSCRFCKRDFKSAQAIKAHLRHCKTYQSVPKAETLPKAGDPSVGRDQYEGTESMIKRVHSDDVEVLLRRQRPGRDSHESLIALLDVHEMLTALLKEGLGHYGYVRLVEGMRTEDEPACLEWKQLLQDLYSCVADADTMKLNFRLNHSLLYDMYNRMLTVKERWLDYRRYDVEGSFRPLDIGSGHYFDEPNPTLLAEERRLELVLCKIKRMVVSSH